MTTTISAAARNAACNAIVDLIDQGSTDANGDLVIQTSGDAEVATLALSDPAFGNAAAGVATANPISDDSNATGGTAANFILRDKDNTEVMRGLCGISSAELNLSSLSIGSGDTVSVSSLTATMPASDA
ncbi:hypothetical protein [Roseovarius pacificus]|uniref:hypothetical protein n=1 Tax=Roseovarius pacificus TaxID=337701 RepID=UPI004039FE0D